MKDNLVKIIRIIKHLYMFFKTKEWVHLLEVEHYYLTLIL